MGTDKIEFDVMPEWWSPDIINCYSHWNDESRYLSQLIPQCEWGEDRDGILEQLVAVKMGWSDITEPGFVMRPVPLTK